jgi:hypothetical protein
MASACCRSGQAPEEKAVKLRIKGDSVRLRLTQREVLSLVDAGHVEEATRFPGGESLRYVLSAAAGVGEMAASFRAGTLTVALPPALARRWAESEEVGIRATLPLGAGELSLLIEKDFPCPTARPGEDDSDAFRRGRPLAAR